MMPKRDRQAEIDALFEKELHEKPRDENFKPALASGGYVTGTGTLYMVVNDEYRPFTIKDPGTPLPIHDVFYNLKIEADNAAAQIKEMGDALKKLGLSIGT